MSTADFPDSITFVPSRVDGLDAVSRVKIRPSQIEFEMPDSRRVFAFKSISRPQESWLSSFLKRLTFRRPYPRVIADRDWFHAPPDRFFRFYTTPPITVYMPADDVHEHAQSHFGRIQQVIRSGRFATFDMG
jgi:hypothetical protein